MKKALSTFVAIIIIYSSFAQANEKKVIPQGKIFDLDKPSTAIPVKPTITTNTATYQGKSIPVYVSKNGKLFVIMTSKKTGKEYKRYLNDVD